MGSKYLSLPSQSPYLYCPQTTLCLKCSPREQLAIKSTSLSSAECSEHFHYPLTSVEDEWRMTHPPPKGLKASTREGTVLRNRPLQTVDPGLEDSSPFLRDTCLARCDSQVTSDWLQRFRSLHVHEVHFLLPTNLTNSGHVCDL